MAYALVIVALIAAGVYTENAAFYWVAGAAGVIWTLTALLVASLAASVKSAIKEGRLEADRPLRIQGRKPTRRSY